MSKFITLAATALFTATPLLAQVAGEAPSNGDAIRADGPVHGILANEEIVPASARTVMGGSSNSIPWSWTPTHFMSVYLGSELPQSAYPIRCIGFRANNRVDTGATIDIEIWLGVTSYDQGTITTTYASNYNIANKPRKLVLTRQKIKLDDMIRNTNPGFFQYQIPLTTPFIWQAIKGENLIFECKIYGNSNNNSSFSFFPDNESGTGTTTTRLYSNNDANATTAFATRNYGPVLRFDLKCKVNAGAEDYGRGSTVPLVPGPDTLTIPDFVRTYSATNATRGFWFQAPVDFVITGLQVPDETKHGKQNVALYSSPTKVVSTTPLFFSGGTSSATMINTPPIKIQKGHFVCVLGSCGDANSTQYNSYGNAPFTSNILGNSVVFQRAWVNDDMTTKKGVVSWNYSSGILGRVNIRVAGQGNFNGIVPELTTSARPLLGTTASLTSKSNIPSSQAGLLILSSSRIPSSPTPFGNLLVSLPTVLTIPVPGAGATVPLPIPSASTLLGVKVTWQNFFFDFAKPIYGASNGTEWILGEQ